MVIHFGQPGVGGAGDDWGWSVFYDDDISFVVGGQSWSFTSNDDLLVIKFTPKFQILMTKLYLSVNFIFYRTTLIPSTL